MGKFKVGDKVTTKDARITDMTVVWINKEGHIYCDCNGPVWIFHHEENLDHINKEEPVMNCKFKVGDLVYYNCDGGKKPMTVDAIINEKRVVCVDCNYEKQFYQTDFLSPIEPAKPKEVNMQEIREFKIGDKVSSKDGKYTDMTVLRINRTGSILCDHKGLDISFDSEYLTHSTGDSKEETMFKVGDLITCKGYNSNSPTYEVTAVNGSLILTTEGLTWKSSHMRLVEREDKDPEFKLGDLIRYKNSSGPNDYRYRLIAFEDGSIVKDGHIRCVPVDIGHYIGKSPQVFPVKDVESVKEEVIEDKMKDQKPEFKVGDIVRWPANSDYEYKVMYVDNRSVCIQREGTDVRGWVTVNDLVHSPPEKIKDSVAVIEKEPDLSESKPESEFTQVYTKMTGKTSDGEEVTFYMSWDRGKLMLKLRTENGKSLSVCGDFGSDLTKFISNVEVIKTAWAIL